MMPSNIANPRRTSRFSVSGYDLLQFLCIQRAVVLEQFGLEELAHSRMGSCQRNIVPEAFFVRMQNYPGHQRELDVPGKS